MNDEILHNIDKKLDVLISLQSRKIFSLEAVREIVSSRKRDPEKYIDGYNALDGTKSITEIARVIGVSHGTLSPILKEWEIAGIVYELTIEGGTFYKHLRKI